MVEFSLSQETIGLIAEVEKRLRARLRDAIDEGERIVFVTEPGQLGQALGKQAKNLQMLRDLLNKDVKFVEFDEDKQVFVRNLFKPFVLQSIRLEETGGGEEDEEPAQLRAIVEVEPEQKGKAIGKGGRNIASIRSIAKKHHEIDAVIVL